MNDIESNHIDDSPHFFRLSQTVDNKDISLISEPVFCTFDKAVSLAVKFCNQRNNFICLVIRKLGPDEEKILFEKTSENDLSKYL